MQNLHNFKGTYLPEKFARYVKPIEEMDCKNSDIWVSSFPKSGTTWTQEMVWLLANNLDYEGAKENLKSRFPFLEFTALYPDEKILKKNNSNIPPYFEDSLNYTINYRRNPRFIKTHLSWDLLPAAIRCQKIRSKVIYIHRNPKDVCVSFYYHSNQYTNSIEEFTNTILNDNYMYCPYWSHVHGYLSKNHHGNILILKYEDMKNDLIPTLKTVTKFLSKTYSDEQLLNLSRYLSFESMRNNPAVNNQGPAIIAGMAKNFIRKGIVGDHKNVMSPELIQKFDAIILEKSKQYNFKF